MAIKLGLAGLGRLPSNAMNSYLPWLHCGLYLVLIGLVLANRQLRAILLVLLGVVANALVVFANAGRMPVTENAILLSGQSRLVAWLAAGHDPAHQLAVPTTRLVALGDWIPVQLGLLHMAVSPGDIILTIGAALVLNLNTAGVQARESAPDGPRPSYLQTLKRRW
jgi:hypothetical protein